MRIYKKSIALLCIFLDCTVLITKQCEVILKSKWHILDHNTQSRIDFGGRWILAGSITFKKKTKEFVCLTTISLHWDGDYLENIVASLYKKNPSKEFLPIDNNLVCDGIWNKTKQTIVFNFDEKETLHPTTTFYLVLTIPENIEYIIRNGSFSLEEHTLPNQFKQSASIPLA